MDLDPCIRLYIFLLLQKWWRGSASFYCNRLNIKEGADTKDSEENVTKRKQKGNWCVAPCDELLENVIKKWVRLFLSTTSFFLVCLLCLYFSCVSGCVCIKPNYLDRIKHRRKCWISLTLSLTYRYPWIGKRSVVREKKRRDKSWQKKKHK